MKIKDTIEAIMKLFWMGFAKPKKINEDARMINENLNITKVSCETTNLLIALEYCERINIKTGITEKHKINEKSIFLKKK